MTGSLPPDVQQAFDRFITTEYTTLDKREQPITWPVTPYYSPGDPTVDVTTGLGYPKKANDARANPKVALLFSDPTGSDMTGAPMVLVQGIADVDDRDLEHNRARYNRESAEKLPALVKRQPPEFVQKSRFGTWYYARVYVCVRPERIYVWPGGDCSEEPRLLDTHMEEVRSGHAEEPVDEHGAPSGGATAWSDEVDGLGSRTFPTAVLSVVSPDGFPFSVRVPVAADRDAGLIHITAEAVGVPLTPGLACLAAHEHDPDFKWQKNFHVRGDLVEDGDGWAVAPHKVVGGFNLPKRQLDFMRENAKKMRRYRKIAKRELAKRAERG